MTANPRLSVVVCSYNGATRLSDCLVALCRQKVHADVLVVDDGSTDGTEEVALSHGVPVVRHEINRGISVARNTGLRHAISTIVAFCDDDCTPPANWTERLLTAWSADPQVAAIGGIIKFDRPITFSQRYLTYSNPFIPLEIALAHDPTIWYRFARQLRPPMLPKTEAFPVYSVLGGNMSFDRERALEVGGFDENLIFGEGEEVALCESLRNRFGEKSVILDPRIVLSHRFDSSVVKTWRRSFAYGRGAAERWRKHGGFPSIPVVGPAAVIGTAVLAPFSLTLGLAAGLLTLATPVVSWASLPDSNLDASAVAFPIVDLVNDLAGTAGFARELSGKVNGKWRPR